MEEIKSITDPIDFHTKVDEIINKFNNGRELYKRNALFNRCVQMLVRDENPYDLILRLVHMADDCQNAMKAYIERDTRPIGFPLQ